mmetsp:Transcript_20142/g.47041  ORF Transcript_20142/g.47041 Transcript_20142/m.47041 type:complete len:252 (-) Transcript_20142:5810-6565(-)
MLPELEGRAQPGIGVKRRGSDDSRPGPRCSVSGLCHMQHKMLPFVSQKVARGGMVGHEPLAGGLVVLDARTNLVAMELRRREADTVAPGQAVVPAHCERDVPVLLELVVGQQDVALKHCNPRPVAVGRHRWRSVHRASNKGAEPGGRTPGAADACCARKVNHRVGPPCRHASVPHGHDGAGLCASGGSRRPVVDCEVCGHLGEVDPGRGVVVGHRAQDGELAAALDVVVLRALRISNLRDPEHEDFGAVGD